MERTAAPSSKRNGGQTATSHDSVECSNGNSRQWTMNCGQVVPSFAARAGGLMNFGSKREADQRVNDPNLNRWKHGVCMASTARSHGNLVDGSAFRIMATTSRRSTQPPTAALDCPSRILADASRRPSTATHGMTARLLRPGQMEISITGCQVITLRSPQFWDGEDLWGTWISQHGNPPLLE